MDDSSHSFNLFEWIGGLILAAGGLLVARWTALHKKVDRVSEEVAALTVHIEHNRIELDDIHETLKDMREKMDRRRKEDVPNTCVIKDFVEGDDESNHSL